ncbi:hypothetical protein IFM89_018821 [Coptis chinensis]|uniref:Uncharacterized protein n=1 Tax=Coptis chinensis TaxID=261450 RepID=A0A835LC66_9MAGN|nr:hypothetical protein IFM89_018821 [Coptis chinensis]
MEDSMNASMKRTLCSKETSVCPEESGWTGYFDDFFTNNREHSGYSSAGFVSTSLVSDAASCNTGLKFSDDDCVDRSMLGHDRSSKKLSFKRRRSKEVHLDDDLEDTASSPVNSPKVSDMNPRKKDGNIDNFKSESTSGHTSELQSNERNELGFGVNRENEYTELQKRGLCLVPLSMLVNYLA